MVSVACISASTSAIAFMNCNRHTLLSHGERAPSKRYDLARRDIQGAPERFPLLPPTLRSAGEQPRLVLLRDCQPKISSSRRPSTTAGAASATAHCKSRSQVSPQDATDERHGTCGFLLRTLHLYLLNIPVVYLPTSADIESQTEYNERVTNAPGACASSLSNCIHRSSNTSSPASQA